MERQSSAQLHHRKYHAFTLIELLVVIAIISVLAALLMPALTTAIGSARTAQCASNQRNVFIGLNAYADDYGDAFPKANRGFGAADFYSAGWPQSLIVEDYFSGDDGYPSTTTSSGTLDTFFEHTMTALFDCPSAEDRGFYGNIRTGDYGINTLMLKRYNGSSYAAPDVTYFRRGTAQRETKLFLIGDNREWSALSFGIDVPSGAPDRYITRHAGGGNFVFHDGHYERRVVLVYGWGKLPYFNNYDSFP